MNDNIKQFLADVGAIVPEDFDDRLLPANHKIELEDALGALAMDSGFTTKTVSILVVNEENAEVSRLEDNNIDYQKKDVKALMSKSDSTPKVDSKLAFPIHRSQA